VHDVGAARPHQAWIARVSALAFAVLFIVGMMMEGAATDTEDKSADEILKTFDDRKSVAIIGAYVLVLAGLAFLPLAWGAIGRVRSGLSAMAEQVARWTALLFVAMTLVAGVVFASLAGAVELGGEDDPPADLVRFIPQIGYGIVLIAGALSAALFLVVVSRAGQAASAVPTWFWVLGYIAAVAMLAGVIFVPMILLPIWAIASAFVVTSTTD
jgi:hypothetical protein